MKDRTVAFVVLISGGAAAIAAVNTPVMTTSAADALPRIVLINY